MTMVNVFGEWEGFNTNYTPESILKVNNDRLDVCGELLPLYDVLTMIKEGKKEKLESLYYYREYLYNDYLCGRLIKRVGTELVMRDKTLSFYLQDLYNRYSKNGDTTSVDHADAKSYSVTTSNQKFSKYEVGTMFLMYLMDFAEKHDLTKFKGESDAHRNNKLYKYIKIDFENNVLKVQYNEKMGIERVQVDKQLYMVKTKLEDVLYDDALSNIRCEENYSFNILDSYDADNNNEKTYTRNSEVSFLFTNYREILTQNQLEKFNALLEWCLEEDNDVEMLFNKNNPMELSKTELSKILFPDRKSTSTMKDIENMLKSMNSRNDKALEKNGVSVTKKEVISSYNPLPKSTRKDNASFKKYQLNKYIIGVSTSNLPESPMYKSVKRYNKEPFILYSDYENVLNGELTVDALLKKYDITNDLISRNGKMKTYQLVTELNDDGIYDLELSKDEVQTHLQWYLNSIYDRIKSGNIQFTSDGNGMMKANTNELELLTEKEVDVLTAHAPHKAYKIICSKYNTNSFNNQHKKYKLVEDVLVEEKEKVKYITVQELVALRSKKA